MDKQTLTNLIEQSKSGSRKAMEQLLYFAHTPVSWQCCRLLNDQQLAEEMTERILKALSSQIDKIENADHFHKLLGNITATRCMRKREQVIIKDYIPENQDLSFPSNELSKAETAQVAQILADSLPEEHRICLILSACCRVSTKAISQLTGFAEEAVTKYITEAELGIREQMQVYQNQGVVFAGSLAIGALLRTAMYSKQDRSAAVAMIRKLLPPVASVPAPIKPPKRPNNTIKILLCVAVALVLLIVLLICGVLMGRSTADIEETTMPSTTSVTEVTETTEATTEATTEETTEPTTEPTTELTTEATTVPETTEVVVMTKPPAVPENTAPKTSSNSSVDLGAPGLDIIKKPSGSDYNKPDDGHTHEYISMGSPGNPTCTKPGRVYRVCKHCNTGVEADDPSRPALGHDHQLDRVVPPTTSSQGYTIYKCTRCSDSYKTDYVDALPTPETQAPVVEMQTPVVETQAPAIEQQEPEQ